MVPALEGSETLGFLGGCWPLFAIARNSSIVDPLPFSKKGLPSLPTFFSSRKRGRQRMAKVIPGFRSSRTAASGPGY